jgi:hypothetical protein
MTETLTIQDAMNELKRINALFAQRGAEISKYASKRKGEADAISNQKQYLKEKRQSFEDLMKRYITIKTKIQYSNLTTSIKFGNWDLTVAEALVYKQTLITVDEQFLANYNLNTASNQINEYRRQIGQLNQPTQEMIEKLNLVPELFYDEIWLTKRKEDLMDFKANINNYIDKSNHIATITL